MLVVFSDVFDLMIRCYQIVSESRLLALGDQGDVKLTHVERDAVR